MGGYLELGRKLTQKLQGSVSLRVDKSENFEIKLTPRTSFVYQQNKESFFRASFQNGFRNPSLSEQFIFQNLGEATLTGGLQPYLDQLDLPGNSFFVQTVDDFNDNVIGLTLENFVPLKQSQAELASLSILADNIVQSEDILKIVPEKVNSWEIGYRSLMAENKLVFDINYYFNLYRDFIGLKRVIRPKMSPAIDLFLASRQVNNSTERDVFFIYANADNTVTTQGLGFSLDYASTGGFLLGINGTWAKINSDEDDPIIPGFNTPSFKLN